MIWGSLRPLVSGLGLPLVQAPPQLSMTMRLRNGLPGPPSIGIGWDLPEPAQMSSVPSKSRVLR